MGWVLLFYYLLIGAAIGYFMLGMGYKHRPAPYWRPREMIRNREDVQIILGMAVLWFPLIAYLWLRRD